MRGRELVPGCRAPTLGGDQVEMCLRPVHLDKASIHRRLQLQPRVRLASSGLTLRVDQETETSPPTARLTAAHKIGSRSFFRRRDGLSTYICLHQELAQGAAGSCLRVPPHFQTLLPILTLASRYLCPAVYSNGQP